MEEKTASEKLIEALEKSGIKLERFVLKIRKSNDIANFIKAQEESSKRALECKIPLGDYCPDVAGFLKQKRESENRKLPEMYFKFNYN